MHKPLISSIMILLILSVFQYEAPAQSKSYKRFSRKAVLEKVNKLRENGCYCDGERMPPVPTLEWHSTLEKSAYMHAKEMQRYNYFDHISINGKDVGQRLDKLGYKWHYVGENLAVGQKDFDHAMRDWIKSPSHCKMLMNPNMTQIGISRYGKYWVQHFGKPMPPKMKRTKVTYTEG